MRYLNVDPKNFELSVLRYYRDGGLKGTYLRLGQFLWNEYGNPAASWPEFFYETDDAKVLEMARVDVYEEYSE